MADHELVSRLGNVSLFQGLSNRNLRRVVDLGHVVEHKAGHEVVQEGRGSAGFHLILDGEAAVLHGNEELKRLGPDDHFGEISLLDGKPRTATVRAETPLRTFSILAWDFRPLLDSQPELARNLLTGLCSYVRESAARQLS